MMLLLFWLFNFGVLAFAVHSTVSLMRRVRASELVSLRRRRWVVALVSLICVSLHVWSYWPIRCVVPPEATSATVVYGGPGDGLFFLFFVVYPWLIMQVMNVGLACFCATTLRQAAAIGGTLLTLWIAAASVGTYITSCPPGVVHASG